MTIIKYNAWVLELIMSVVIVWSDWKSHLKLKSVWFWAIYVVNMLNNVNIIELSSDFYQYSGIS